MEKIFKYSTQAPHIRGVVKKITFIFINMDLDKVTPGYVKIIRLGA